MPARPRQGYACTGTSSEVGDADAAYIGRGLPLAPDPRGRRSRTAQHQERGRQFLLRFAAGSRSPTHTHPGGEEIYVISGKGRLDDLAFGPGDFVYTPPGEGHTLHAETEVVIHVVLPEPVIITE